jgi:hypothetical protein
MGVEHAFKCVVVGFGAAARKDNLTRLASQKTSYLTSRLVDRFSCRLPGPVIAGRVAERASKGSLHGVGNFRRQGRTCIEVEVDSLLIASVH